MAEKKKKSRAGKTAPKKKPASPRRQKAAPAPKAGMQDSSSPQRAPLYLLIILVLLATLAILANQYFSSEKGKAGTENSAHISHQKSHEALSKTSLRDEKKEEQEIREQKNAEAVKKETEQAIESRMKIYFLRINDHTERVSLVPVTRTIKGKASLEKAIGELIKGPSSSERSKGILSAVPSNIRLRGVAIKNGVAEIDFTDAIERNAAGSILMNRLDQIIYTATELEGIHGVIIKINGRRKQTFGSDGLSIGGPLHRRQ